MLRNAQDVPIRILEPRDLGPVGRRPDAEIILRKSVENLQFDSGPTQAFGGRDDIRNVPAQDSVLGQHHFGNDRDTQLGSVRVKTNANESSLSRCRPRVSR